MGHKSTIDRMPAEIRDTIARLREKGRTIDEIRDKLGELDVEVARSTLGRHIKRIDAVYERVKESRAAAEAIMSRLGESADNRTARLNIELMHANLSDLLMGEDGEEVTLDPESAMFLGRTLRDLATASKYDVDREVKVRQQAAKDAAKAASGAAKKAGLSEEAIAQIESQVLGIAR